MDVKFKVKKISSGNYLVTHNKNAARDESEYVIERFNTENWHAVPLGADGMQDAGFYRKMDAVYFAKKQIQNYLIKKEILRLRIIKTDNYIDMINLFHDLYENPEKSLLICKDSKQKLKMFEDTKEILAEKAKEYFW